MKIQYNLPCNIAQTLNIIGDKWSLLILNQLFDGRETYKEIQDGLEGIPTNLLSERLKSLETNKLIVKKLYQTHPPRYKYILTEMGCDLVDVFNSFILWGEKHLNKCCNTLVHKYCNGKVEHKYYFPNCDSYLEASELCVIQNEKISEV
ncbi:MAG: helix-turn-helix domain-containing protein [Sedimentibacter sp.]|uniref:winged helix-turn-helix transcriptional regulator n=1 Tax=Sedimentibacter sp. TaxID=1960295 RepID=UPI002980B387|nr:helix-turn-helix domain-containing protein [Sedimentibacter sp.]MDW5299938.1 helix-turn-helix domain-containing protein [Sedimentibacter sp.]